MTVYLFKSDTNIYAVSEVLETEQFYLVPVVGTYTYDLYNKKLFKLETQEVIKSPAPSGKTKETI